MSCVNSLLSNIKGMQQSYCCENQKELPKITNIAETNGKVIVTFDNNSFIQADFDVIDKSLSSALSEAAMGKIKELTEFKEKIEANLEPVMDLGGKISHYVLKTTFLEGN